jgi:hypothetical protein
LAWIEEQDLVGKELVAGHAIEPKPGARNPNVIRVEFSIPLESKPLLYNVGLRKEVLGLFYALKETLSPISSDSKLT